uniref:Uncharacterized protein n=1 Tax=Arundo donax TaxID=35708 RepID=A0A0A9DQ74_ARUDO
MQLVIFKPTNPVTKLPPGTTFTFLWIRAEVLCCCTQLLCFCYGKGQVSLGKLSWRLVLGKVRES